MIELKHVFKEIHNDELVVKILNDITLTVDEGEFVTIMGPSGSGKSTLMNIIGFLDTLSSGVYTFKGSDVSTLSEDQLSLYRCTEVGFIFQAFNLLPKTTVLENVKMPLMYHPQRKSDRERTQIAQAAIASVGLENRMHHLSNQLSGGEKQRVAIARALVNNPSLILADEPTGNLDSKSGLQIMSILQKLNEEGKTIVIVTHEHSTAQHAKRIITIRDGELDNDQRVRDRLDARKMTQLK